MIETRAFKIFTNDKTIDSRIMTVPVDSGDKVINYAHLNNYLIFC